MSIASTLSRQQCLAENPGVGLSRPGPGGSWSDESLKSITLRQLNQNSTEGAYNRCHSRNLDWECTILMDEADIMAPAHAPARGWCSGACHAVVVCHDSVSQRPVDSRNAVINRYLRSVRLT